MCPSLKDSYEAGLFLVFSVLPQFGHVLQSLTFRFGDKLPHKQGIICVVAALFVWKLVPETKGKTLEDMTKLWQDRKNKK